MNDDSTQTAAILRPPLGAGLLWEFATAFYARPGIEALCLQLQDEAGVDVCELLWRCWLLGHGRLPSQAAEAGLDEVRRWQREISAPLRHLRRRLKVEEQTHAHVAALRGLIKRAELEAEREALSRLERLTHLAGSRHLCTDESAEKVLANTLNLQKKHYLLMLDSLIACLDPPSGSR